ncbi:unnamed protein product, partial [Rotaria sordida]
RTTIVIAHRLTTIQNAHQIYVLDKGSIIEEGTHETLMAKEGGKYQAMVKRQQIEGIYDDQDDMMSIQKATEEDEKSILERSRLMSDGQILDINKQSSKSFRQRFVFLRLLSMNSPEWITILIGCIACILNGAAQPLFAFLLVHLVEALQYCLASERRHHILLTSFLFLLLGALLFILRFFQYTAFAISGSKLTERIRSKAFACLLRQEVAYFDRPENSSGAICTRLSSDASAVQEMTGTRLGVICEVLALSFFGIIFGFAYGEVCLRLWRNQQSDQIITRASAFAAEVLHNMRTIKQISIEKEVLRQYSELIHKLFISSWKPLLLSSMAFSIFWTLDVYALAFLYWRALILIEKNELTSSHIIAVFAFAVFTIQALKVLGMISSRVAASFSAAEAFFDLFDRKSAIDNTSTEGQELVDFRGEIKFDQVKFIYPTRPTAIILDKFQLNINPSQHVALVGMFQLDVYSFEY